MHGIEYNLSPYDQTHDHLKQHRRVTYEHVIVSIVPRFLKREESCAVVDELVTAILFRIRVEDYPVSDHWMVIRKNHDARETQGLSEVLPRHYTTTRQKPMTYACNAQVLSSDHHIYTS